MKKLIALILALVLCLSLCACGSGSGKKEIKLTLDNYSDYLLVKAGMREPALHEGGAIGVHSLNNGNGIPLDDGGYTYYVYEHFITYLTIEGASTNFNYNDVSITVRFGGTYKTVNINTCKWDSGHDIYGELTAKCNIAGAGKASGTFLSGGNYLHADMADIEWEVVSVSGTVTPAY